MIRKSWNDNKWLLTRQVEHARVAGLMAAAWKFPNGRPNDELFLAVTRHDDGWATEDEAPRVTGAGCPMDFMDIPALDAALLWRMGVRKLYDEGKYYAARLVAGHFSHLARTGVNMAKTRPKDVVEIGKFIGEMTAISRACAKREGEDISDYATQHIEDGDVPFTEKPATNFESDLRLLQVCDLLSIFLSGSFTGELVIPKVPYLEEGDSLKVSRSGDALTLTVSPLPFRKNLRDHLAAIIVPRKVYESDADLRAVYRDTPSKTIEFHIGGGQS